jgi:PqqD family protein of HPr-rel-A system
VPAARPKVRADLTVVELDHEAVVYDEASGDLHHLNPTATVVFGLCDGTSTAKELSADISEAFGVSLEEVEPQVRRLVRELRKAGLLESNGNGR